MADFVSSFPELARISCCAKRLVSSINPAAILVVKKTKDRGKKMPPKTKSGVVPRRVITSIVLIKESNSSVDNLLYEPKILRSNRIVKRNDIPNTNPISSAFLITDISGIRSYRKINDRKAAISQVNKLNSARPVLHKNFKI